MNPGSLVLHYRILRAIGSGGMGVVYEAEDAKLGRRVALKFLPPEVASDRAVLERFQREARAASALNHPNICTIHAIENADGAPFIAMELLDGDSLDRRLADRPLAWDALVDTAVQIADALEAAHRRGIIHRDIKPANIFLTKDGRAKVLDFGIAKVTERSRDEGETIGVATAQRALTGAGVTVGTIAYMSPEQARGEDLDARSDLFSLAAVLYEVSTGRRAFDGTTSAVVFQRILDASVPEAPRRLNPTLPIALEDVILKGLEKDRELRYQTAADLRADLKRIKRDASSGRLAFVPAAPASGSTSAISSGAVLLAEARRHKSVAGVAALAILALTSAAAYGIYAMARRGDAAPSAAVDRSQKMTVTRLTTSGDVRGCGSISPDGKYVAYCDFAGQLKIRQVASGSVVLLGRLTGATTFSPDSNFVYIAASSDATPNGVLWSIPVLGGEPRRVLSGVSGAVGVSPDGRRIAFLRTDHARNTFALMTADALGGNEKQLAAGSLDETWFESSGISWSADGRRLSATQASIVGGFRHRPVSVDVESGRIETLGATRWVEIGRTVWMPDGSGILFAAREHAEGPFQFWTVRYPDGHPVRLTNDTRGFGNISVSVTADGSTIATVPIDLVSNVWRTDAEASAPLEQWTSGVRNDGSSGLSAPPGGRVYFSSDDGAEVGIWSIDAPGGTPRKLVPRYAEVPSVPADGRFVVFQAIHEGRYRIWRAQPDGTDARALSDGEDDIIPVVSPDGRWVYYAAGGSRGRLMRVPSDGGKSSPVGEVLAAPVGVSNDGRALLVNLVSRESVYAVLDPESGAITSRIDLPGVGRVSFGRRSELVAFIRDREGVGNLWEQPIAGGPARQLTKFTDGRIFAFTYSRDGKRLFLARGRTIGDVVLIRDFR